MCVFICAWMHLGGESQLQSGYPVLGCSWQPAADMQGSHHGGAMALQDIGAIWESTTAGDKEHGVTG